MSALSLNEYRCPCGKLLLKGIFFDGILEIKCKKCGIINKIGHIKLLDNVSRYLLVINKHGIITNASDSACRILDYTFTELVGKIFTEIDLTILKELSKELLESVLTEDNFFQLDTVHQTKAGRKIPVTVRLKLYQSNDQEKYVLVSAELRDTDEKVFDKNKPDFLNSICDFCFEIDANGIGEYVCPSVEKIFGFPPEAIIGKNFFDYLPVETKATYKESFDYFSANKQSFRSLHTIGLGTHGQLIHTELYFTAKFNDNGKFVGYRVLGWVLKNT